MPRPVDFGLHADEIVSAAVDIFEESGLGAAREGRAPWIAAARSREPAARSSVSECLHSGVVVGSLVLRDQQRAVRAEAVRDTVGLGWAAAPLVEPLFDRASDTTDR